MNLLYWFFSVKSFKDFAYFLRLYLIQIHVSYSTNILFLEYLAKREKNFKHSISFEMNRYTLNWWELGKLDIILKVLLIEGFLVDRVSRACDS